MNKNQIQGTVKDLTGKVQEEAGKLARIFHATPLYSQIGVDFGAV